MANIIPFVVYALCIAANVCFLPSIPSVVAIIVISGIAIAHVVMLFNDRD